MGRTPELDFEKLWEQYPEERRGNRQKAAEAFRVDITSVEDADQAMESLELWKRSEQWHKAGGQFIPYMDNWFSRGLWRTRPKKLVISGPRELDAEELEAIQRMLKEGNHEA